MKKPKIALVGVGSAGTKIANEIANSGLSEDIKTVSVEAFEYQNEDSNADIQITLYKGEKGGLHQPIPPSRARDAALEAFDEIKDALKQ